jgi:ELWxxDGT repeat protein
LGVTADSQVYFAAREENLVGSDVQLWRSDGNMSGTYRIGRIRSALDLVWHPENQVDMKGVLYFATDPSGDGGELWRSDGTPGGTYLVQGAFSLLSYGLGLVAISTGDNLYFAIEDEKRRSSIWRSDGTSSGTVMLKDFGTSDTLYSQNLAPLGSIVLFAANDGVSGSEPWKTDGTPAGTTIVKDIVPGSSGSYPWNFTTVGSHTFFTADDEIHGRELWKTDGSASGTVMVRDITPGASSSDFQYFKYNATVVGDLIYFKNGGELWRSDGTTSGTFMLRHSLPYFLGMHDLTKIGSMVYFSDDRQLEDQSYVDELWRTDGTTSGTIKVKEFHPSPLSSYSFGPPVPAGSFFYFLLGGWNNPVELWKSDGSEAGTVRIKSDLGVEMISCPITVIGSCAFFTASTASAGTELWMSDGTPEGTAMLKDIWPGSRSSRPREAVAVGSALYFLADEPVNGCNLWKSDGTEAGTVPVRYVPQGPYTRSYWAPYPVPESSSVFFFRDWLGWPNALWRYGESRAAVEPGWAGYR